MRRALQAYARFASRSPKTVLGVVFAVVVLFAFFARDVRLDNNFAALFSTESEEAQFREDYRRQFGPDDGLLVAVLHTDELTPAFVDLLERTTNDVSAIDAMARVNSVTTADLVGRTADGQLVVGPAFGSRSTLGGSTSDRVKAARASRLGAASLISADGRTLLIVGEMKAGYDSYESVVGPAEQFERVVREAFDTSGLAVDVKVSGVAYTRLAAIHTMEGDLLKLSPLATVLMALLLWVIFRRVAAVVGPLMAISASIVITAGVIGLNGDDLNQVTVIYPILMMGVVVAAATHLLHRFYRERAQGKSAEEAGRITIESVTRAAFVSALTTAVGFASLIVARMQILHEFGLYLAAGVMAAFVVECAVIPCVLVLADSTPHRRYLDGWRRGEASGSRTDRYARFITRRRVAPALLVLGLLLVAGSMAVASGATYDYALSSSLDASDPISQGNRAIDTELSGIIPIEVSLRGSPGQFRDPATLAKADALAQWLEAEYGIRSMGLPALLREENKGLTGIDALPADAKTTGDLLDLAAAYRKGDYVRTLVNDDSSWTRLRGFTPDTGGRSIVAMKDRFEAHAAEVLAGTGVTARVTGEAPVAYAGMNDLTQELINSTFLALVMVVIAIALVFRSIRLALVAVLPNVVPVVFGLALYTLTNDVLDPLPGVVFCIAMGLAADDTIHLINRSIELRGTEASSGDALVTALVTARKAMVSSTAVLVAGFMALTLSGFAWNRQLGILGGVVLVLALASDLVFGPAGLAELFRLEERRARRRGSRAGTAGRAGDDPRAGNDPIVDLRETTVALDGRDPAPSIR